MYKYKIGDTIQTLSKPLTYKMLMKQVDNAYARIKILEGE